MRRIDKICLAVGVLGGLLFSAVVWAITIDEIWRAVYDSSNTALRVNQVAGS